MERNKASANWGSNFKLVAPRALASFSASRRRLLASSVAESVRRGIVGRNDPSAPPLGTGSSCSMLGLGRDPFTLDGVTGDGFERSPLAVGVEPDRLREAEGAEEPGGETTDDTVTVGADVELVGDSIDPPRSDWVWAGVGVVALTGERSKDMPSALDSPLRLPSAGRICDAAILSCANIEGEGGLTY